MSQPNSEMVLPSETNSGSSYGITLVLDPDEAGLKAAADNGSFLQDLFRWWGITRYPDEPVAHALAVAQRTCDDLAEEIQIAEAMGWDTAQTEDMRLLVWDYMMTLYLQCKPTPYSTARTPEEYAAAVAIEDNPIVPTDGRINYEAIKERIDIVDYISRHTELRPASGKFYGKCPLPDHEDSTASLWVYPHNRSWYCFGCRRGGDVITYAKLQGVNLGRESR